MTIGNPYSTSVLLPVLLRETSIDEIRRLRIALQSIHDQKFPGPFEILIVDDGSPYPVEAALRSASSKGLLSNVRFVRCDRNGGIVHALNRGLAESQHPFVARIDADDYWLPTKIEKQFLSFDKDPNVTIAATGMRLVDSSGKVIKDQTRPSNWDGILQFFVEIGCPFPHGSILARRDIYHLLGGYSHDPRTSHAEDFALWGIWLRFFKPAMIDELLYVYTVANNSISTLHRKQQLIATAAIRDTFRMLGPVPSIRLALTDFARTLELSLICAGKVAYRIWRFRLVVELPYETVEPLQRLLPDRTIRQIKEPARQPVSLERLTDGAVTSKRRETIFVEAS